MRPRNREVNIFNMSLLDILCGALGAFCFMMLALFPDHAKVKALQARVEEMEQNSAPSDRDMQAELDEAKQRAEDAEKRADQAKLEQSLLYIQVAWQGGQDIDLWVQSPSGRWYAPKEALVPADRRGGTLADRLKGPAREVLWFSDVAYPGLEYRFFVQLQARNGESGPATVRGYFTGRVPVDNERSVMGLYDFGEVTLTREQERVEIGSVQFVAGDFNVRIGPKPPAS